MMALPKQALQWTLQGHVRREEGDLRTLMLRALGPDLQKKS